jgi:RNA polymerase sigma-70 factor (ECF subfamily)
VVKADPHSDWSSPARQDGDTHRGASVVLTREDQRILVALRNGDEKAFASIVERHNAALLRLARVYVADASAAEEVVQETWLGFIESLDRFEGRASIKTWLFRILINIARRRRGRDARVIPFSSMWRPEDHAEAVVDPGAFRGPDDRWPAHWLAVPRSWEEVPEDSLLSGEALDTIRSAIDGLPPAQREVITLRDVEGWTSNEVCNVLSLSETNQRVLLHRARSRVRRTLSDYIENHR